MNVKILSFIASLMLAGVAVAQQPDEPARLGPMSTSFAVYNAQEPRPACPRPNPTCPAHCKKIGDECSPADIEFE